MSHRRLSTNGAPRLAGSLHRCVIALCSNPAVADGVCEMHHSSGGSASTSGAGRRMNTAEVTPRGGHYNGLGHGHGHSLGQYEDPQQARYSSRPVVNNLALQPQSRATKKHKPNPAAGKDYYPPLTKESLNQMANRIKYAKGPTAIAPTSSYDNNPYLQGSRPTQDSTTGSVQSDSEHSQGNGGENGGGDKETSLRRERNRIAARKSRQRKLDRISNLEEEKMRLEQHRDMLVQEIRSLEKKDSGATASAVLTITDREYSQLQAVRLQTIKAVETAYNNGDIFSTMQYFRDDSIVSGPQNSSVHLRGKDALVLDYLCTTYLFRDVHLHHAKVDSGGPRSQHFRVHWVFSGLVKSAGVSMNKEFLELIDSVKGKRVTIEGVSNFSFSGDKIVYVHRTADQAKFLSALVALSKD